MELLSVESLQRYFTHLWGFGAVEVQGLYRFSRGVSRETWGVEFASLDGRQRPSSLILRRALSGAPYIPRTLRFEYDLARRLAETNLPVARPVLFEDDPAWTFDGREFFLREQIEGSWNIPHVTDPVPEYDDLRVAVSKEMISKLAAVHGVDWRSLGFQDILEEPVSLADAGPRAIRQIYGELAEFQFEPQPVLAEVKEWLLDNAPVAPKIVLLKGTNGLGEEVFLDGRIVALSDWEQCSLGDPAQDFARTQDLIPEINRDGHNVWGMKAALAYYEELTGIHVKEATVDYYRLLGCVDGAVYFHCALQSVVDGSDPNIRRAYLACELSHNFLRKLLDAVYGRNVKGQSFGTLEVKEGNAIVAANA